jgi:uncharacterized repeat protein (TIGR03803 family)
MATNAAHASTVTVIHSFCKKSGCPDGGTPNGVFVASSGDIYGTTQFGSGTVFEMKKPKKSGKQWKAKTIYTFCALANCADGRSPFSKLVADAQGDLYGTTFSGGAGNMGTVFELVKGTKKSWALKTLASFCIPGNCDPAASPQYGLSYAGESSGAPYDGKSPLFGLAGGGTPFGACKPNCGTAYEVTLSNGTWTLQTIYEFCTQANCSDGYRPVGELLVDSTGSNLTGAAATGVEGNNGGVFKLTRSGSSWTEQVLYAFCQTDSCSDGAAPGYGPTPDAAGNLIGMASRGGNDSFDGVLYKITPALQEQILYSFCALTNCTDGAEPGANNILIDASGDLYGATQFGGGNDIDSFGNGGGTLFKFAGGSLQTLYRFCAQANCADGEYPTQLAFGRSGTIVGTTSGGGAYKFGEVFQITP